MKRIIRNKVYDTDGAKFICSRADAPYTTSLYRKRTGEYFIHIAGGDYGHIQPVSAEEARIFASENMDDAQYMNVFLDDCTDFHFLLPPEIGMKMKRVAEERGISLKSLLIEMIKNL